MTDFTWRADQLDVMTRFWASFASLQCGRRQQSWCSSVAFINPKKSQGSKLDEQFKQANSIQIKRQEVWNKNTKTLEEKAGTQVHKVTREHADLSTPAEANTTLVKLII